MAQVLKEEVERAIRRAALEVFARDGYEGATMAAMGREAGVSTGNIYRYFGSKEALFEAVIPDALAKTLMALVEARVAALRGVTDLSQLPPQAPFRLFSAELLWLCISHRHAVVVLLARARGTPHADFGQRLTRRLVELAQAHFQALPRARQLTPPERFLLERIYRNLLGVLVEALAEWSEPDAITAAVRAYERYHLAGLLALFTTEDP